MSDYLNTLRRIPDDIMLAIFAHDFDERDRAKCICGWALRERIARSADCAPEDVSPFAWTDTPVTMATMFGGSSQEWSDVFKDAMRCTEAVERAVVDRLNEIVS